MTPPRDDAGHRPAPGDLPRPPRAGIGLCLSGGGYRATLFHLGALTRINELGLLARPDFRTVTSVSGGSLTAAHLATVLARRSAANEPLSDTAWESEVRAPLRRFTRRNIRTRALLARWKPWRWLDDSAGVESLAETYARELTPLTLAGLPARPGFVFCATDMSYGVSWTFTREAMGSYRAGYMAPPAGFPVARAVAASSCYPPVFNPMRMGLDPARLRGGDARPGPERDACIRSLRLTDGGVYDNLGLEPVWRTHAVVLVSDAGGLFAGEADRGLAWRVQRYQRIQERQARALRKRWLLASFRDALAGAYWGVGGAPSRYGDLGGYSKALALSCIAEVRTDFDAFSDAEAGVLENHGYLMADAALRRHLAGLMPDPLPPLRPPCPEWLPPRRDEAAVAEALKDSGRRTLLGRR